MSLISAEVNIFSGDFIASDFELIASSVPIFLSVTM